MIVAARSNPEAGAPQNFAACGPPADMWAYGLLAAELLTGRGLFQLSVEKKPATTSAAEWLALQRQRTADLHRDWVRVAPAWHLGNGNCCF
jgi:hypothetical protein